MLTMDAEPKLKPVARAARTLELAAALHPWRWVFLFVAALLAVSAVKALALKMWIDELYTYYIVQQPTVSDLMSAIREGCDGAPPLYALIVRGAGHVFSNPLLALRMPAALGVCIMCICVFAFTYRRFPAIYALLAMLFACDTCLYFATEGRCYGLVLACAAGALLMWQTAADGRYRMLAIPILCLSLATGIALHYYTVFLIVPLLAGELYRWWIRRQLDWPVVMALALAPLVLIPHLPLIRTASQFTRYYWSKASVQSIFDYSNEFYTHRLWVLILPLLVWYVWRAGAAGPRGVHSMDGYGLRAHEWVVCGVAILMPAFIVAASLFTTKTFVTRYVLWAVIGFTIFVVAALFRASRGNSILAIVSAALLLALLAKTTVHDFMHRQLLRQGQAVMNVLTNAPSDPRPILIADHHAFMELAFYAPPALKQRLVYAVSPELDRLYTGVDTGALLLSSLRHREPLNIPDYEQFIRLNSRFLLAASADDWVVWRLQRSGWQVVPVRAQWTPGLFLVTR